MIEDEKIPEKSQIVSGENAINKVSVSGVESINFQTSVNGISRAKLEVKIQNRFNWRGFTILIVEDNFISFKLLEVLLKNTFVTILHADNGQKAVDLVSQNPEINLVLMDIQLPLLNGYQATTEIKMIRPALPIIAQTANTMDDDKIKCIKAGCDDYITKPIDFELFFKKLDLFLQVNN